MPHHYRCRNPVDPDDAAPDALVDYETPYEEDMVARVFVLLHPNGATLEAVGAVCGVTRERIRQIEAKALRKLRIACDAEGITVEDFLRSLGVELREAPGAYWQDNPYS